MPKNGAQVDDKNILKSESLVDILNENDKKWYWDQCTHIRKTTGYHLNRRKSGISALRMYLMGAKGFTLEQALNLDENITSEQLKAYLEEMFLAYGDPKKSPEDRIEYMGKIQRKALDKIMDFQLPALDEVQNIEDLKAYSTLMSRMGLLFIDFSQDIQDVKDTPEDHAYRVAFYKGAGDIKKFEQDAYKFSTFAQGIIPYYTHIYVPTNNLPSKCASFDRLKALSAENKGKKISELNPLDSQLYQNGYAIYILPRAAVPSEGHEAEYEAYLNGQSNNYPGKEELENAWKNRDADYRPILMDNLKGSAGNISKKNIIANLATIPDIPADANVLELPEETRKGMIKVFYEIVGEFYRNEVYQQIVASGITPFHLIKLSDNRSIYSAFNEKYKNLSVNEKEDTFMLETMKALKNDPAGINLDYIVTQKTNGAVGVEIITGARIKNNPTNILIADSINAEKSAAFLIDPNSHPEFKKAGDAVWKYISNIFENQKAVLDRNNMDILDNIYVGNKTLKEIFEEKYADKIYTATDVDIAEVCMGILMAESYNVDTPIFATVLSENELGFISRNVLPISFEGANLKVGQRRNENVDAIKQQANAILSERSNRFFEDVAVRNDVMQRATQSIEQTPDVNIFAERIGRLKTYVAFMDPAANAYMYNVFAKMDELNQNNELKNAMHQYRLYNRAARLAPSADLRREYGKIANGFKNGSPMAEYEKLLRGLELCMGVKKNVKPDAIPADIQDLFIEKTGQPIPGAFFLGAGSGKTSYRPESVEIDVSRLDKMISVNQFITDIYDDARNCFRGVNPNGYILVGGKTIDTLLKERFGGRYRADSSEAKDARSQIIIDAINSGDPVDLFVVSDRNSNKYQISPVPVHLVGPGVVYNNLNPEKLAAQRAAYETVIGPIREKDPEAVSDDTEELISNRERYLNQNAQKHLKDIMNLEGMPNKLFQGTMLLAQQNRLYYVPPTFPQNSAAKPGKAGAIDYIVLRLAEESMKMKERGEAGYSIEDIFSLNKLSEEKKRFAEEYSNLCKNNDSQAYHQAINRGAKALKDLHMSEHPANEAFASQEAIENAFLGKNLAVFQVLDNVKTELTAVPDVSQEFLTELDDYTIFAKTLTQVKLDNYSFASGVDPTDFASFEAYEAMKYKAKECLIKGIDPYKGLAEYASKNKVLNSAGAVLNINLFRDHIVNNREDFCEKLTTEKLFDSYYIDHKALSEVGANVRPGRYKDVIRRVTVNEKKNLEREQEINWEYEAFHMQMDATRDLRTKMFITNELSPNPEGAERPELVEMYDKMFGPLFSSETVQAYLNAHPDLDEFDLIHVGNQKFRDYVRNLDTPLSLKALAVKFATDPSIPFGFDTVTVDPLTNEPKLGKYQFVIDNVDRERIVTQSPKLKDLKTFKDDFLTRNGNINLEYLTDSEWQVLYESQFAVAAKTGIIADDKVVSSVEIQQSCDKDIPMATTAKMLETVYGAKQTFVKEWADTAKVYTKDIFIKLDKELNPGKFSNSEFATLAFFTSLDENVITGDIVPGVSDELMSRHDKTLTAMNNWTTDFRVKSPIRPRENIGEKFDISITPAREKTEEIIGLLQNGNVDAMATVLSNGVKNALEDLSMKRDFKPNSDIGLYGYMLKQLNEILKANPELQQAFNQKLSPDEQKLMSSVLRMNQLMEDYAHSVGKLNRAVEEPITDEEKISCLKAIAAYNHFSQIWEQNYDNFDYSNQHMAKLQEVSTNKVRFTAEGRPDLAMVEDAKYRKFVTQNLKPSAIFLDDVLDENLVNSLQNNAINDIAAVRQAVISTADKKVDAENKIVAEKLTDENGQFIRYNVSLENAQKNKQNKLESEYMLEKLKYLFKDVLTKEQIINAGRRYNMVAVEKGDKWPVFNENPSAIVRFKMTEDDTKVYFINSIRPDPANSGEAYKQFFSCMIDELIKTPQKLSQLKNELDTIKLPHEMSLADQSFLPESKRIDEMVREVQNNEWLDDDLKAQTMELLDDVNNNMAELKDDVKTYLFSHQERGHVGSIERDTVVRSLDNYKNGKYVDLYDNVKVKDSTFTFDYKVVKPEKAQEVQDIINDTPTISPDIRAKIIQIVNKMTEYGMITGNSVIEEGNKIYSYRRVYNARAKLKDALKTGNNTKIKQANDEYNIERDHMREIHQMVNEAFPDRSQAPGNVDSIREKDFPAEFAVDVVTNSRINGLFQLGEAAKKAGVPIDQYIDNPGKCIDKWFRKAIKEKGFDSLTKPEDSFLLAFSKLNKAGRNETLPTGFFFTAVDGAPGYAISRPLDAIYCLDTNVLNRLDQQRYEVILSDMYESMLKRESMAIEGFHYFTATPKEYLGENYDIFRNNMKIAFLQDTKIQKSDLPMQLFNEDGVGVGKLNTNYDTFLSSEDRYDSIIINYNKSVKDAAVGDDEAKILIEEAMFDYLMAHPEDMDRERFKRLEEAALGAEKKLNIARPAGTVSPAVKYKKWRSDFKKEIDLLQKPVIDRDKEVNKQIIELQKKLVKMNTSRKKVYTQDEKRVVIEKINSIIKDRLEELREFYKYKEIPEAYTKKRANQLLKIKADPITPVTKLPDFIRKEGKIYNREDAKFISDRVLGKVWPDHLKSKDAYIEWRLEQPDMKATNSTREELSENSWDEAYRAAIHSQELPYPVLDVFADLRPGDAKAFEEQRIAEAVKTADEKYLESLGVKKDNGPDVQQLHSVDGIIDDHLSRLPAEISKQGRLVKSQFPVIGTINKMFIGQIIAIPVSYGIVKNNGGKMPVKGGSMIEIASKIANDPSFQKVIDPYINNMYKEYVQKKANYEKDPEYKNDPKKLKEALDNIAEYDSYKVLAKDIKDLTILKRTIQEQKNIHAPENKEHIEEDIRVDQGIQNNNDGANIDENYIPEVVQVDQPDPEPKPEPKKGPKDGPKPHF